MQLTRTSVCRGINGVSLLTCSSLFSLGMYKVLSLLMVLGKLQKLHLGAALRSYFCKRIYKNDYLVLLT